MQQIVVDLPAKTNNKKCGDQKRPNGNFERKRVLLMHDKTTVGLYDVKRYSPVSCKSERLNMWLDVSLKADKRVRAGIPIALALLNQTGASVKLLAECHVVANQAFAYLPFKMKLAMICAGVDRWGTWSTRAEMARRILKRMSVIPNFPCSNFYCLC